jgi:hypothetical protein
MGLKIFSKNLKYLMKKAGTDKETLRAYMRLTSVSRIESWMAGNSGPRREQLIDLCDALGYYDIYKMFTVDLSRQKQCEKKVLPASVTLALQNIEMIAAGALHDKRKKLSHDKSK